MMTDTLHQRTSTGGKVGIRLGLDIVTKGGRNQLHLAENSPLTSSQLLLPIYDNTHRPVLTFDTTEPPTAKWGPPPPPVEKQN